MKEILAQFNGISSSFELYSDYISCSDRARKNYKNILLEDFKEYYVSSMGFLQKGAYISYGDNQIFVIPIYHNSLVLLEKFMFNVDIVKKNKEKNKESDNVKQIKEFYELLQLGIITQEEYDKKKTEILNKT